MNIHALLRQPVLTVALHPTEARWTIGARRAIARAGSVPLPAGCIDDGVVMDPAVAGRLLADAPGFPRHRRVRAVVALPAQRSVFRVLDLPALRGKQFADLARREIRRQLPMLAENAYICWARVSEHAGTARVQIIGVARDVLDSHVAALHAARLAVVAADLRVVAAARAVGHADCILADVERDGAEIAIFRSGVPAIIRSVVLGAAPDQPAWGQQLGEELERTLKFYRDSHRGDTQVADLPISVVGGEARQAALAEEIVAITGHAIAVPPLRLGVEPERDGMRYAANMGLTLKDLAA